MIKGSMLLGALLGVEAVVLDKKHHKRQAAKYEPDWGHNSGSSYNNGPFTHFYHGKASPFAVTNDDLQIGEESGYEPLWGHNSGNSYNNGPFTHFYYGKASPYAVTGNSYNNGPF